MERKLSPKLPSSIKLHLSSIDRSCTVCSTNSFVEWNLNIGWRVLSMCHLFNTLKFWLVLSLFQLPDHVTPCINTSQKFVPSLLGRKKKSKNLQRKNIWNYLAFWTSLFQVGSVKNVQQLDLEKAWMTQDSVFSWTWYD